jgi:uncharacterized membrane protein YkvI
VGGAALTLLGLCLALPLLLHYKNVASAEIPLLMVVMGYGPFFTGLYMAVLLCAIFSTAATNAFAVVEWCFARWKIDKKLISALLCAAGLAAAHIGFSNIVGYAYPVFGWLGAFETAVILMTWRRAVKPG